MDQPEIPQDRVEHARYPQEYEDAELSNAKNFVVASLGAFAVEISFGLTRPLEARALFIAGAVSLVLGLRGALSSGREMLRHDPNVKRD